MKNNKSLIIKLSVSLATILVVIFALFFPAKKWMTTNITSARQANFTRRSPVIFVPGSSATQERFNDLIDELQKQTEKHSILKMTVNPDNTFDVTGKIDNKDLMPYIVIAFKNNEDTTANIKNQAGWLDTAMTYLAKNYKFNNFVAIGHSNGGLNWTLYLEKFMDKNKLQMQRLMTIGTPYNLESSSDTEKTPLLNELISGSLEFPKNLVVYSIAGTTNFSGDGIVPIESVNSAKYVFQDKVKSFTEITLTGDNSNHSDLVENTQLVDYIKTNIINRQNRRILSDPQSSDNQQNNNNNGGSK